MCASYLQLGLDAIAKRVKEATQILEQCILCPHHCKVNRLEGELGFCESGTEVIISSSGPHYGEEPPISGLHPVRDRSCGARLPRAPRPVRAGDTRNDSHCEEHSDEAISISNGAGGSGTIFFTNCNLRCVFCQNYQISQQGQGNPVITGELADIMLSLQTQGCHNINLVSPTHFVPQILSALALAIPKGLKIPIVYNTNGYDSLATLKLLDGIVDIYLPDIKYADDKYAKEYSDVGDYVKHNRLALKEMYRQTGNLVMDENGIAQRGLIIRHLVLPNRLSGTFDCLDFIAKEISNEAFISLMSQYHPSHKAAKHPLVTRRLKQSEYQEVLAYAEKLGLENCYIQELVSSNDFLPDFRKNNPFEGTDTSKSDK